MNGKQNFIFFLGITIMLLNLWYSGALHALSVGIFSGSGWQNPGAATTLPAAGKGSAGKVNKGPVVA